MDSNNNQFTNSIQTTSGKSSLTNAIQKALRNITDDINMNGSNFKNVGNATQADNVYNKAQVDNLISQIIGGSATPLSLNSINDGNELNGDLNLLQNGGNPAGFKLLVDDPVQQKQVSNKAYTDQNDAVLQSQINQETTARQSADTALDLKITTEKNRITQEITDRIAQDTLLDGKITTQKNRVDDIETTQTAQSTTIQSIITDANTETAERTQGDTTLQENIDIEKARITSEITNRTNADTNLQNQITTNANRKLNQIPLPDNEVSLNNQDLKTVKYGYFDRVYAGAIDCSDIYGTYPQATTKYQTLQDVNDTINNATIPIVERITAIETAPYIKGGGPQANPNEVGDNMYFGNNPANPSSWGQYKLYQTNCLVDDGTADYWNDMPLERQSQPVNYYSLLRFKANRLSLADHWGLGDKFIYSDASISSPNQYVTKSWVESQIPNVQPDKFYYGSSSSASKAKMIASGDNAIDIYCNNASTVLGKFYQALGQSTNPFVISSPTDKLQLVSGLNAISSYGSKSIDTSPLALNTNGFYVTSNDISSANVQNIVSCSSEFSPTIYMSSGHIGNQPSGRYAGLFTDAPYLQLSGSLDPTTNPVLQIYPSSASSENLKFKFNNKVGYSSTTAITEANQFASKAYVDSQSGGGGGSTQVPVFFYMQKLGNSSIQNNTVLTSAQTTNITYNKNITSYNDTTGQLTLPANIYSFTSSIRAGNDLYCFWQFYDTNSSSWKNVDSATTLLNQSHAYNNGNYSFPNSTTVIREFTAQTNFRYFVQQRGADTPNWIAYSVFSVGGGGSSGSGGITSTSQLTVDSGLNFATGGYRLQSSDPINNTDVVNKQFYFANLTNVSGGQYIQNSTNPNSRLSADGSSLMALIQLDMNANPIINVQTPTTDLMAANKVYVDIGLSGKSNTNHTHSSITSSFGTLQLATNNLRFNNGSSIYWNYNTAIQLLEESILDRYIYDFTTSSVLQRTSTTHQWFCRPMVISNSSTTTTNDAIFTIVRSGTAGNVLNKRWSMLISDQSVNPDDNNGGCLFQSACRFNRVIDTSIITGNIIYLNGSSVPVMEINSNTLGSYATTSSLRVGYRSGGSQNDCVAYFNGRLQAISYDTIVPISDQRVKKNIALPDYSELETVDYVDFEYDIDKMVELNQDPNMTEDTIKSLVSTRLNRGFIAQRVAERYQKQSYITDQLITVEYDKLKDDLFSFLLVERRRLSNEVQQLKSDVADLKLLVQQLLSK